MQFASQATDLLQKLFQLFPIISQGTLVCHTSRQFHREGEFRRCAVAPSDVSGVLVRSVEGRIDLYRIEQAGVVIEM